MATADELLVIEPENGVVGVEEIRMKDNFDAISRRIEQLNASDLVENGVIRIVCHVMGRDGR